MRSAGRLVQHTRYRFVHTVVMIRHGESAWNSSKRFTGWCDVPLTTSGVADAEDAGRLMLERGMKFDVAFTSSLERAWRTCALALSKSGQSGVETIKSWKLNERHYGALQGHLKTCPKLMSEFGEQQLIEWRRAYDTAPPSLSDAGVLSKLDPQAVNLSHLNMGWLSYGDSSYHTRGKPGPANRTASFPGTESLKDCEIRAFGYWERVIAPRVRNGERVLIVAHANTIRALVKAVDKIRDDMIQHLRIPNGIPLIYTLDSNLQPIVDSTHDIGFQAKYLISPHNHEKMMEYEVSCWPLLPSSLLRKHSLNTHTSPLLTSPHPLPPHNHQACTRKKLVALFEYLDKDRDGVITPFDLQSGMTRLQSFGFSQESQGGSGDNTGASSIASSRQEREFCEFEIEELLRCVPHADGNGGITLESFLASETNILPGLTKLRLLQ